MKTALILAALILSSCTTVTETRPDGTVVVTRGVDLNVFNSGAATVTSLVPVIVNSGK